jgi:hypothetical protein
MVAVTRVIIGCRDCKPIGFVKRTLSLFAGQSFYFLHRARFAEEAGQVAAFEAVGEGFSQEIEGGGP